jgi:hypothetical protein
MGGWLGLPAFVLCTHAGSGDNAMASARCSVIRLYNAGQTELSSRTGGAYASADAIETFASRQGVAAWKSLVGSEGTAWRHETKTPHIDALTDVRVSTTPRSSATTAPASPSVRTMLVCVFLTAAAPRWTQTLVVRTGLGRRCGCSLWLPWRHAIRCRQAALPGRRSPDEVIEGFWRLFVLWR